MSRIKKQEKNCLKMNNKLNILGLAQAAGKLISGESLVLQAVQVRQAKVVIIASDCSEATIKKISNKCKYYKIPFIVTFDTIEISQALGKKRSIICLTDKGFAKHFNYESNENNLSGAENDMKE